MSVRYMQVLGGVLLMTTIGCTGETCIESINAPGSSSYNLTTRGYPAMITASQCQCYITAVSRFNSSVLANKFDIRVSLHIELRRQDDTVHCQSTQVSVLSQGDNYIICPDSITFGGYHIPDLTTSLTHPADQIVINIKNTELDFINARIIITVARGHDVNVTCLPFSGAAVPETPGKDALEEVSGGVKAAIVIIILLLMIAIAAVIKYFAAKKRLEQRERKKRYRDKQRLEKARQRQENSASFCVNIDNNQILSANELHENSIDTMQILNVSVGCSSHRSSKQLPRQGVQMMTDSDRSGISLSAHNSFNATQPWYSPNQSLMQSSCSNDFQQRGDNRPRRKSLRKVKKPAQEPAADCNLNDLNTKDDKALIDQCPNKRSKTTLQDDSNEMYQTTKPSSVTNRYVPSGQTIRSDCAV